MRKLKLKEKKGGKMPYKIVGKKLMHKKGGKWSVKQNCSSHANAVKALGLLKSKGY